MKRAFRAPAIVLHPASGQVPSALGMPVCFEIEPAATVRDGGGEVV